MDDLTKGFDALAMLIDRDFRKGITPPITAMARRLGMRVTNFSDGSDINMVFRRNAYPAKLTLRYLFAPMGDEEPFDNGFTLELHEGGREVMTREWHSHPRLRRLRQH